MVLLSIVVLMIGTLIFGSRVKEPTYRHYAVIVIITFIQVAVIVIELFTKKLPPLR